MPISAYTATSNATSNATSQTTYWQQLPKVLLHEHLDGGLRPQTLLELCQHKQLVIPATNASELADWMLANANAGSLVRYLDGFALTVAAMASLDACERVAFEAAEDARLDGCVLAEFRMAPLLLEEYNLAGEAVVEALIAGLQRSDLACGLIVCGIKLDPPEKILRAAKLAACYQGQGVIGFDLAGPERGFPPALFADAMALARNAGLGVTFHAGEADDGSRVLEAVALGATRIGHGINVMYARSAAQQKEWLNQARAAATHFEVCPTSNVHTGAVASLATHPLHDMIEAGLSVSCSTDNRLMSGVTMSAELQAVHDQNGVSKLQIKRMMQQAAAVSFLPETARNKALETIAAVDFG